MLTKVSIKNFRGLNIETDLKRVNVIVGKNGTGKTNFLEAIYLSAIFYSKIDPQAIQGFILAMLNNRGDLLSMYNSIADADVTVWNDNEELKITYKREDPYTLDVLYPRTVVATMSLENAGISFMGVNISPMLVRVTVNQKVVMQKIELPIYIPTNFDKYTLTDGIISHARYTMNTNSNFEVAQDEYGRDILYYKMGDKQIPAYLIGRGLLKEELIKDSLLFNSVVLIDEIEDSLYPDTLLRVLKTIKESKTQVIFTTNSNDVLRIITEMFNDDEVNLIYLAKDGYKIYHEISLFKDFEKPLDWVGYL